MADDIEVKVRGRLSFFRVYDPQDRNDDAGNTTGKNYNTVVLINKTDTASIDAIKAAMKKVKETTWGDSPPRLASDQLCLRDGEPVDEETGQRVPLYDGYAGCVFLSANRPVKLDEYELIKAGKKRRPVRVIGPRKSPETGRFEELNEGDPYAPYSGCEANVIVRIYAYVPKAGSGQKPRINASLEAVQFAKDGERFGASSVDVDSAFDEEDVQADDMGGGGSPAKAAEPADEFDIG
jgi:hypothetical protein